MQKKLANKINLTVTNPEEGITLIALVVTIVILLILAGVSILVLFGDNGIIKTAEDAADKTNKAEKETLKGLDNLSKWLTGKLPNSGSGSGEDSKEELKGPFINQYLTPVNAVDVELFGREVNYSVPNEELAKKLGAENKWVVLYRGNSFSEKEETETYLITKGTIWYTSAPAAVDIDGNKTSYVPENINSAYKIGRASCRERV